MEKMIFFKILAVIIFITSSFYGSQTAYSSTEEQKEYEDTLYDDELLNTDEVNKDSSFVEKSNNITNSIIRLKVDRILNTAFKYPKQPGSKEDANYKDHNVIKKLEDLMKDIKLVTTKDAFADLTDGKVTTWGNPNNGGDPSWEYYNDDISFSVTKAKEDLTNVTSIVATDAAFAALKDGKVITWGSTINGGDPSWEYEYSDDTGITISVAKAKEDLTNVTSITATYGAFAALKEGKVITWGDRRYGGDPSYEDQFTARAKEDLTNVTSIVATNGAFAALKKYKDENGKEKTKVITWGSKMYYGGDPSYEDYSTAKAKEDLTNVTSIIATNGAFAALKKYKDENGKEKTKVITWGDKGYGGDSSYEPSDEESLFIATAKEDLTNVTSIAATEAAFAALKDGKVITWGRKCNDGGDPSYEDEFTTKVNEDLINVTNIVALNKVFVAFKKDKDKNGKEKNKAIIWGNYKECNRIIMLIDYINL